MKFAAKIFMSALLLVTAVSCRQLKVLPRYDGSSLPARTQINHGTLPHPQYALREDTAFKFGKCVGGLQQDPVDRLRWDTEYLSSAACDGREAGTRGSVEASAFIYRQMRTSGLNPRIQSFKVQGRAGHNVIGEFPGRGEGCIVLLSYYDGVGTKGGSVYPGADSNASGVAAMLELARRLKGQCRQSIIVAALDAHSLSMAGASEFTRSLGNRKIDLVVNIDILGSNLAPVYRFRKDYILCLGGKQFSSKLNSANSSGPDLHMTFDYYGSKNFTQLFYETVSDHRYFKERGVPCVMFTSGITYNTNKSTDTCDILDYDLMNRRVELIARFIKSL